MIFTEFLKYIPKIVKQNLPGVTAHIKMAPIERIAALQKGFSVVDKPRKSAVMLLVYPKEEAACFVLIKRNSYPGVHSSQISFPGGKADPEDIDLQETALRETFEEIGIMPENIIIKKQLSEIYIPPSNFLVSPFLGITNQEIVFNPDAREVEEIIEVPLSDFMEEATVVNVELQTSYADNISVPAYIIQDHIVWGATAMMLSEFKECLKKAMI